MFRRKARPVVPDDTGEAKVMRAEAQQQLAELEAQAPSISRTTDRLIERRKLNHFGESVQITFRPRGGHL